VDTHAPAWPVVWTVGHSDRTAEDLVALLRDAGIRRVVDVRASPFSRRHPWHARPELERRCAAAGLGYSWLGAGLGGLRPEGYDAHRDSDSYARALAELDTLARAEPSVVLCAEKDPANCHRRFIADDLVRRGFEVRHLIAAGHVLPHQPPLL
jgi:uncharacterized protein (DUF488 family)